MADEEQGTVLEVENNSQETPTEEPTQTTDSESDGTTAQADSEGDRITEGSAKARTKEQIQESERHHQSVSSKLKTTVAELQQRLKNLQPRKLKKTDESSQEEKSGDGEEEYVNTTAQIEKAVGRVFDKKFKKLTTQATRNEQMRTIDELVFRTKKELNISDKVFSETMSDYGPIVELAIEDEEADVSKAATMFLNTLVTNAGLERDSEAVEIKKVEAARIGKALEGVQKPATGGAPPTPAKKTEGQELLERMQEAGGNKALRGFFASKTPE